MLKPQVAHPGGYGMLAMVVVLLAMSLAAAVALVPNPGQVNDQWRVLRTQDRLALLTDSTTHIVRFFDDVGNYPGALSHLSNEISGTGQTLCGVNYGDNQTGNWSGRYAGRLHEPVGTPLPMGMMKDTLEYDATAGDQALVVVITGVREEQARQLDRRVDGIQSDLLGRVRYTAADAEGLVTLRWRRPITQC